MSNDAQTGKERAGRQAAEHVRDGMRVGLGTGSTARHTIAALAERRLDIVCVATSEETNRLASERGLRVVPPDEVGALDIAIDGADEVDPRFNLVKGGGGALTREKIVAEMAARFLVIVDEAKLVVALGAFGLPVEALAFAPGIVAQRIRALGASDVTVGAKPSDNGNTILLATFGEITQPERLAERLAAVPGVVEHGLFLGRCVERVIVGGRDGVRELVRPGES